MEKWADDQGKYAKKIRIYFPVGKPSFLDPMEAMKVSRKSKHSQIPENLSFFPKKGYCTNLVTPILISHTIFSTSEWAKFIDTV